MALFFTSDTHYFHKNIIRYAQRPFKDMDEMHEKMIQAWNSVVPTDGTVYHLGDVFFGNPQAAYDRVLKRLNGQIYLIRGNHDGWVDDSSSGAQRARGRFDAIQTYAELVPTQQHPMIVLCHFPILEWNKGHKGSFHLHGHCHGSRNPDNADTRRLDVGVDSVGFSPVSSDEIARRLHPKPFSKHHND